MTVLLVLFTLIIFLVVDHFVQKSRTRTVLSRQHVATRVQLPMQLPIHVPEDVALATNHTWVRTNQDGTITIGLDEFLGRLVGLIEKISLPQMGEMVTPAFADIVLGARGHVLRLASPADGSVIESNPEVMRNPSLILSDPYGKGWLMRMKLKAEDVTMSRQYLVRQPIKWLREQVASVRDFVVMNTSQGQPEVLQEGGLPVDGVLQRFDESVWRDFSYTFAVLRKTGEFECKEIHT